MATLAYKDVYDIARARADQHGYPMHRQSTNSQTQARVDVGVAGTHGAAGAQERKAAYHRTTSEQQQRADPGHVAGMRQHMLDSGVHPNAVAWLDHYVAEHHSHNKNLLAFAREFPDPRDKERAAARNAEQDAGRRPRPATPGNAKADTGGSTNTKPSVWQKLKAGMGRAA